MQEILNLSKKEKERLVKELKNEDLLERKGQYEEIRGKIGSTTVTVYKTGKVLLQGNDCKKVKAMLVGKIGLDESVILGVDETGRGENYGPFVVSGVLGRKKDFVGLRDSKKTRKIGEKYREVTGKAKSAVSVSFSSDYIDELRGKGLTMNEIEAKAIDAFSELYCSLGEKGKIVVDGNKLNVKNKKIIFEPKADDKNTVVSAASVLAKHLRDESADKEKRKSWRS